MAKVEKHAELLGLSDRALLLRCGKATHQHYKGGLYRYLGIMKDADTGEILLDQDGRPRVAYEHLYPYEREIWSRKALEWFGNTKDGKPRFRRIGS